MKQTAKIVHAVSVVNPIVGMASVAPYRDWYNSMLWGMTETCFRYEGGNTMAPHLCTYWKLSADGMQATIGVRKGTKFNSPAGVDKDFGELTAEDVVWYMNDANSNTNPKSTHGDAGDFAGTLKAAKLVDQYTLTIDLVRPLWIGLPLTEFGTWAAWPTFISKKAYDTMGVDWIKERPVGTGPFILKEWIPNDRGTVVAIPQHWNDTARIKEFQLLQVPEASSRVAMLKTGAVDSVAIDFKFVADLMKSGFVFTSDPAGAKYAPRGVVTENASLLMSGNLWEEFHARDGSALEPWKSPVYAKDYPWIGNPWGDKVGYKDPDNPAGMDDMEQARLVRNAMALAIDREGIVTTILNGMGWGIPTEYATPNKPEVWKPEYAIKYDPKKAAELLDKAGYPKKADGTRFDLIIYNHAVAEIGEVALEVGEAIASTYEAIGIKTTLDRSDYGAVVSPMMRKRELAYPPLKNADHPTCIYPADWPLPQSETSYTRPGWGAGFESPFLTEMQKKISVEPDRAKRVQMHQQVIEYMLNQHLMIGVIEIPRGLVINPRKIKSWEARGGIFLANWGPQFIVPVE